MIVFEPEVSVRLIKTIDRAATTFDSSGNPIDQTKTAPNRKTARIVDLNQFLGDGCSIKTTNSIRDISGTFSLTMNDRIDSAIGDSIYAAIEPMDIIEIRMAHAGYEYHQQSKKLPVLMRGFVSEVNRDTTIGQDGRPSRHVTISGHDFGKLLQIFQIYYLNNAAMGSFYLSPFEFFRKYGDGGMTSMESADKFIKAMVAKVLNPFLQNFLWQANSTADDIPNLFSPVVSIKGTISPYTLQSIHDKSLEQMLVEVLDIGPFNEMFIDENDTNVNIVFRPAPFLTVTGDPIQGTLTADDFVDVHASDLQSLSESRSDRGIANFYWVSSHNWSLIRDIDLRLIAQSSSSVGTMLKFKYPNCSLARYNLRRMEVNVNMGPATGMSNTGNGKKGVEFVSNTNATNFLDERRRILGEANKDNVVFESGTMKLRGNEKIRQGRFIRLLRTSGAISLYYVVSVEHEFVPMVGYFTTVQYERGTGFIDRVHTQNSPYWAENSLTGFE
jgi:hypothetical protein